MWSWLPENLRPTGRGVVENTIANAIAGAAGVVPGLIVAALLTWWADPNTTPFGKVLITLALGFGLTIATLIAVGIAGWARRSWIAVPVNNKRKVTDDANTTPKLDHGAAYIHVTGLSFRASPEGQQLLHLAGAALTHVPRLRVSLRVSAPLLPGANVMRTEAVIVLNDLLELVKGQPIDIPLTTYRQELPERFFWGNPEPTRRNRCYLGLSIAQVNFIGQSGEQHFFFGLNRRRAADNEVTEFELLNERDLTIVSKWMAEA